MKAGQTTLRQLIEGEKQYRVPLYQRPYKWDATELRLLWDDMLDQYDEVTSADHGRPARSLHFIGSFVLAPQPGLAHGVASFVVIDGQQRLTTLLLALVAARDALRDSNPSAAERLDLYYLKNKFAIGDERYKVLPTQSDRQMFFACVDGAANIHAGESRVAAAYKFFSAQLARPRPADDGSGAAIDPDAMASVILERLAIVDIVTEPDDNPNRIFESLNATGIKLTQADLLRNYIFMLLPKLGEQIYHDVWMPMEAILTQEQLVGLARVDLQRRGIDAKTDEVYRLHRDRLEPFANDEARIAQEVMDLGRRAGHYERLVNPASERDVPTRQALARLQRWGAQTTYPLLMHIYDLVDTGGATVDDLRGVLDNLESFLVRRYLVGVATNPLNKLFIEIIKTLPKDGGVVPALRLALSGERRYWPTDDQIRAAARARPYYLTGRAEQRRLVLERLEQNYGHRELVDLINSDLSIEHIMPQTLSEEWRAQLSSEGEDPDQVRDELVHTLGNLTLTAYNGSLSNSPFERKKQIFGDSNLQLNKSLRDSAVWGRTEILARADELADNIVAIWPAPIPGAKGAIVGFDWSRVDAAVSAIEKGRWTTYGDLALLAGTSAQSVGNYMANPGGPPNGYRVLDSQGRVSPAFRWGVPSDKRDPRRVLEDEGLHFNQEGHAEPAQRLNALQLAELVSYEFDAEEFDRLKKLYTEAMEDQAKGLWLVDGRAWHLRHVCSPASAQTLISLEKLIEQVAPAAPEPSWHQKNYIAWRMAGKGWLTVHTRQSWIWMEFAMPPFTAEEAAELLGYLFVPVGQVPSWKLAGPAQVQAATNGTVWVQIKNEIENGAGHVNEVPVEMGSAEGLGDLIRRAWNAVLDRGPTAGVAEP